MPPEPTTKPVVLITGASGLIGTRLARGLADEYAVVGLDVKPPHDDSVPMDFIEADLTDDAGTEQALNEVRARHGDNVASVVHLAAYYDFAGEPSDMYDKLTVMGTRRLLDGLQNLQVEQFIFSSSLLVMRPGEGPLDESSPTEPKWAYPQSKVEAEQVILEHRGNIPQVLVARIAGVYDEEGHSLPVGQQIARIFEKTLESHVFPGNTTHGQALVHLDDLTDFVRKAIERRRELAPEEMFLVAEPDVMSYAELQDRIGEGLHGHEWTTIRIPKVVAKAGAWVQNAVATGDEKPFIKPWMIDLADDHYAVDIARSRDRLGWSPRHRLRDTIDDILRRLKADPERWYETNKLPKPETMPK